MRFDDVDVLPCVSQGATPVGPELTITEAEGNVISELAGQPALDRIRAVIEELDPVDRTLIAGGLLVGLVVDGGRPEYGHGDFLVRQLMGADPVGGTLAVARAGRDRPGAAPARARRRLGRPRPAGAAAPARVRARRHAGGRARVLLQRPRPRDVRDRATTTPARCRTSCAGAPSAGFFAAGEIGPVGGASFLHALHRDGRAVRRVTRARRCDTLAP